ncbi:MAG: UDP-N-acetylmuramate dehydrogenase [Marinilabiliales bacterium]|nr:MAG: UDP-N-acetylmuramate dehydrogenase [Marinilabiliales bacterium]
MNSIKENYPLKSHNTFGVDVKTRFFSSPGSIEEIVSLLENNRECFPFMIIGEGSNILFTKDFNGLIVKPALKGIEVIDNNREHCLVQVGAGEIWDEFVEWAVVNNLGGVENLSLIPGSVGSSPIQNIGAYGAEVRDVIEKVNYLDLETFDLKSASASECNFEYRSSIFKTHLRNKTVITSVVFRLSHFHKINTTYGTLNEEVGKTGVSDIRAIRNAVIKIRNSKLPDPKITGNAGSFFKNPVVRTDVADRISESHKAMPSYTLPGNMVKLPAGWLIEQCGWKGRKVGNAGIHEKQALVLVNHGNASGMEIKELAGKISESVFEKFGITLEPEVNIV